MKSLLLSFLFLFTFTFSTFSQVKIDSTKSCVIVPQKTEITPYIIFNEKQQEQIGISSVGYFAVNTVNTVFYFVNPMDLTPDSQKYLFASTLVTSTVAYLTYRYIIKKRK